MVVASSGTLVAVQFVKASHPLLGNGNTVSLGCDHILTHNKVDTKVLINICI